MKRVLIILMLLYLPGKVVKAQFFDTLQAAIEQKGRFTFSFNSRNSFITNNDAHIFGFMVGVCFDRKFAIGGSFNFLNSVITKPENVDGQVINATLNFDFIYYYAEYIMRLGRHWEIDLPLSIGIGTSSYTYYNKGAQVTQNAQAVIPVEPSIEVDYDFNKYFGLYVQTGYRWMLVNNNNINENFNSPTYSFGILLFPFEIYAGIFPHTKLAHIIEDN
jgi:hypothetical protein